MNPLEPLRICVGVLARGVFVLLTLAIQSFFFYQFCFIYLDEMLTRLRLGDETITKATSKASLLIWGFLVAFFDIMSIVCCLSTYFSNPGYVKNYFRSR